MEIVRIGETKMKLILDSADMKKYGITDALASSYEISGARILRFSTSHKEVSYSSSFSMLSRSNPSFLSIVVV